MSPDMDRLKALLAHAQDGGASAPYPVHSWNPPDCGDIDMIIRRDGTWLHNGTPILRPAMVQLFARLLRRDAERYVLVTPVEKVGIVVEDVPFIAVAMEGLTFRTNTGDVIAAGYDHPLRFETHADGAFIPYIRVRGGLDARLSQGLARELADQIVERDGAMGIATRDSFFIIPVT